VESSREQHHPLIAITLLCALVTCSGVLPAAAKSKAERRAAKKPNTRLDRIEETVTRTYMGGRYRYVAELLASAVLAENTRDQAEVEEWRTRLWGDDTQAHKNFLLFRQFLRGELKDIFELYRAMPHTRWRELPAVLKKCSATLEDPDKYENAAGALLLFAICSPSTTTTYAKAFVKALLDTEGDRRRVLIETIRSVARDERNEYPLSRLRSHLRYSLKGGRLRDHEWCMFLSELTTRSDEQYDILKSLRELKDDELATRLALKAAQNHPTNGQIMTAVFMVLLRTADGQTALAHVLDAESNLPYPARRKFRMYYLQRLRYGLSKSYSRRYPVPEGMLSYAREREERKYAASWADDIEAQMALADVYSVERDVEKSVELYRDVYLRGSDTGMVWTAWSAWSELNPHGAWEQRQAVEAMSRSPAALPVATNTFYGTCFAVAVAAEGLDPAIEWAGKHVQCQHEPGRRRALLPSLAGIAWARHNEQCCHSLLKESNDTLKNETVSVILGLPKGSIVRGMTLSTYQAKAVSRKLGDVFRSGDCWSRAAELVLDNMLSYESAQAVSTAWQAVAGAYPKDADSDDRKLQQELSNACLQWIEAQEDGKSAALRTILQGAGYHLYRGYGHRVRENTEELFFPCLELAAKQELPRTSVSYAFSYYTRGLAKHGADEEAIAAAKARIAAIYPKPESK